MASPVGGIGPASLDCRAVSELGERVKAAAARAGLEAPLQAAYEWRYPIARRDRLDNERLRQLLAWTLAPDSNCVDIGCHRGEVLAEMVRLAPAGHHVAFEPVPASHLALVERFPGVDVHRAAVSDADGEAGFTVVPGQPSFSGLRERSYEGDPHRERITVRTRSVDSALPDGYVPRLIKVDVEGGEFGVFRGALGTLCDHRPTVWFEHGLGGADRYGTRPVDVHRLLCREAGLQIFDADGHGPYSETEFDAVFSEPMWSFVAHP